MTEPKNRVLDQKVKATRLRGKVTIVRESGRTLESDSLNFLRSRLVSGPHYKIDYGKVTRVLLTQQPDNSAYLEFHRERAIYIATLESFDDGLELLDSIGQISKPKIEINYITPLHLVEHSANFNRRYCMSCAVTLYHQKAQEVRHANELQLRDQETANDSLGGDPPSQWQRESHEHNGVANGIERQHLAATTLRYGPDHEGHDLPPTR